MYFISSLIVLSTVCMHACIARHPLFIEQDSLQHGKMVNGVFKFSLNQGKMASEKSSIVQSDYDPNHDGAMIPKASKYSKDSSQKEKTENYTGSAIDESMSPKRFHESTPHVVMLNATEVEPQVSKLQYDKEDAINDSMKERVAEMDYEPPQRKTPIHNK